MIRPYGKAPSCKHDAQLTPMMLCHRCLPLCPLWLVSLIELQASRGFCYNKRWKKNQFPQHLFTAAHFISLASPALFLLQLWPALWVLKFQGLKSDHIHAWPTQPLFPCICMQPGKERSAWVLMVSQFTELQPSDKAWEGNLKLLRSYFCFFVFLFYFLNFNH